MKFLDTNSSKKTEKLTFNGEESHGNQWLQISFSVHEGEVITMEALFAIQALVFDIFTEIFDVSWIFSFTRNPNDFQRFSCGVAVFDMVFDLSWHLFGQNILFIVVIRLPLVDFVKLQEDARKSIFVSVSFVRNTWIESCQINFARFSFSFSIGTVDCVAAVLLES